MEQDMEEFRSKVLASARLFRPHLERRISRWLDHMGPIRGRSHDAPLTQDFCVAACCGLIDVLRSDAPEAAWRIAGGPFRQHPGGMLDRQGVMRGHFWIEGVLRGGQVIIVDVTADQFGHHPLIAEYAPDPRYMNALPEGWRDDDVSSEAERDFGRLIVEEMEFAEPGCLPAAG